MKACELEPVKKAAPTLLDQALEFSTKQQWSAGESVWLWRGKSRSAFLKAGVGTVNLHLVGIKAACPVFHLDRNGWQPVANLSQNYKAWINQVREGAQ